LLFADTGSLAYFNAKAEGAAGECRTGSAPHGAGVEPDIGVEIHCVEPEADKHRSFTTLDSAGASTTVYCSQFLSEHNLLLTEAAAHALRIRSLNRPEATFTIVGQHNTPHAQTKRHFFVRRPSLHVCPAQRGAYRESQVLR